MISRILVSALAAAFLSTATMTPTVVLAAAAKKEETKKDETKKDETKKEKKALSPQQQKMKDCAGKWGEEKKSKKVSGRKAHNEFMSGCLKG
jgi:hypothetical protein